MSGTRFPILPTATLLSLLAAPALGGPGNRLDGLDGACVPETRAQLACVSAVARDLGIFISRVGHCEARQTARAMEGLHFDARRCEEIARAMFVNALPEPQAAPACPAVVLANARWQALDLLGDGSVSGSLHALNGGVFCDASSGVPIDPTGRTPGFVPASASSLSCATRVGRNLGKLARRAVRCEVRAAAAGLSGRRFALRLCLSDPRTGARPRYDAAARALASSGLCPPCLGPAGQAVLADTVLARLAREGELEFPCDTGSLRVAFRDATCPSAFAPSSCATGTAPTCHEAFVTTETAGACTTGHGDRAVQLIPEDGASAGSTSRAWSFAVRPRQRVFRSTYPEATGSVRVSADGSGAAGTLAGASDEAHLRLSIGFRASRVLVLRWYTGGLPNGARGRLRLSVGARIVLDTSEEAGPPTRHVRVWPISWRGDLDLTVSAVVTGRRDRPTPSADLLWRLAVLRRSADDDGDGIENVTDPDPLDGDDPRPRPASSRPKVLVIGLDGAGWNVLGPLIDAGYLPTMGGLVRAGAIGALDETIAAPNFCCFCPIVWSAIATGQPVTAHGMVNVASEPWDRMVPSLWQVLARRGGTSTQIDYRNTFPPEPGTTYGVTESGTITTAAGDVFTTTGHTPDPRGEEMNRLQSTWPPLLFEKLGILPHTGPRPPAWAPFAQDRLGAEALVALAGSGPTDLSVWLMHSPDKSQHVTWASVQPGADSPFDEAALLAQAAGWVGPVEGGFGAWGSVASQYLEADLHLASLLAVARYDYVLVVSDHAMTRNLDALGLAGVHNLPPSFQGVFALTGPGIGPGLDLGNVSVLDVAPTLAYVLGLPVAQDLPGRVLTEAFSADHLAAHPIWRVPTWDSWAG